MQTLSTPRNPFSLLLLMLLAPFLYAGPASSQDACPPETQFDLSSKRCAPIRDKRDTVNREPTNVPSLQELRTDNLPQSQVQKSKATLEEESEIDIPPPGGIGAGTTYLSGTLQTLTHGELHTDMFIYPEGYNPSTLGMDWLFTTATNRVEKGVEVVGIYFRASPNGSLGVFDWSCSQEYPCENGSPEPSWIWTNPFSSFECNIGDTVDPGGHLQETIRYVNKSIRLDDEQPPLWENTVYLWNFCNAAWDLVYEHAYRSNQRDCSSGPFRCSWWGPILETFRNPNEPVPLINELGFDNSSLLHDGDWSTLPRDETRFDPPIAPWRLFHIDANRSYGVGNNIQPSAVLNDVVSFLPQPSTFAFTQDSQLCPVDFDGKFVFTARLKNKSQQHLSDIIVEIDRLSGGNLLVTDIGFAGVGQWFELPGEVQNVDQMLSPNEALDVPFTVCLEAAEPFELFVNVRTIGDLSSSN